jgi:hypothetical protein
MRRAGVDSEMKAAPRIIAFPERNTMPRISEALLALVGLALLVAAVLIAGSDRLASVGDGYPLPLADENLTRQPDSVLVAEGLYSEVEAKAR